MLEGRSLLLEVQRDLKAELADLRLQVLDVAGQEILTRDKVNLRVNLTAGYRVTDVLAATRAGEADRLSYKELRFGLRAAVGTHSRRLLESRRDDEVVGAHIKRRVTDYGLGSSLSGEGHHPAG